MRVTKSKILEVLGIGRAQLALLEKLLIFPNPRVSVDPKPSSGNATYITVDVDTDFDAVNPVAFEQHLARNYRIHPEPGRMGTLNPGYYFEKDGVRANFHGIPF